MKLEEIWVCKMKLEFVSKNEIRICKIKLEFVK